MPFRVIVPLQSEPFRLLSRDTVWGRQKGRGFYLPKNEKLGMSQGLTNSKKKPSTWENACKCEKLDWTISLSNLKGALCIERIWRKETQSQESRLANIYWRDLWTGWTLYVRRCQGWDVLGKS